MLEKFGEDFKVELTYGLHLGWAIEGAIGSHFKFDASYLSPNVNMAARIQSATKYYGVPMLMSAELVQHFCHETSRHCRKIDNVLLKGCESPVMIYTFDTITDNIVCDEEDTKLTFYDEKKRLARQRLARDKYKLEIFSGEIMASGLFLTDVDLIEM